ncbi:MAG: hypothetical protein EU533_03235 [Promethearchaeota archaeon]|nr:MAG: hypothetical protein EU533_03235 [Candidatus Lokiarchaeota archaeon]
MINNITTLFAGEYPLEISVNDTYGNLLSITIKITIQPSLPPTWDPLPSDQVDEFGTNFAYEVNAVDISGIDSYWINDSTYFQINNDGLITHLIEIPVGMYWLKISVNDTLGNVNSAVIKVTIQDTTPPDWVYMPEDQNIEYGTSLSYDVSAWDPSGIDSYWVNDTINFQINGNGLIANCSYLTVKTYWLEISVNDTIGLITNKIIKITVFDTTSPDWIELTTNQLMDMEDEFNYDVNASDLSGIDHYWVNNTVNFQVDGNGIITSVGTLSAGVYWIEVRAYDPYDNYCSSIFKVTVQDNNRPTWDEIPENQEILQGVSFSYDVDASDLSGIDYYWINDTTNFQIDNNGLITSVGTLSVGTYSIEIRAYDPWDNYCTVTIEVTVLSEGVTPPPGIPGYDMLLLLLTAGISGVYLLLHITKKRRII